MNEEKERDWMRITLKVLLVISIVTSIVLSAFLLYSFSAGITAILVVPWLAMKLKDLGVNGYLAYAIVIPIAGLVYYALKFISSSQQKEKYQGYGILIFIMVVWCLSMFFITRNYAFNPKTGEITKCYAETMNGYEAISCDFKVHPIYGTTVKPWTKEVSLASSVDKNGLPQMKTVQARVNSAFFTPSGQPLAWYYEDENKIELFSGPGIHPQMGVPLKPITPEIVKKILTNLASENPHKVHVELTPAGDNPSAKMPDINYLQQLANDFKGYNK